MAYSELIKNFNRTRDYMREFYVNGFKSREEYTKKSARSYDDERRRIESWLGDYMQFHQDTYGKKVFLSIDSRVSHHNPLYQAWKAKSFTDGDITLHFLLMDILAMANEPLSLNEITDKLDQYLSGFREPRTFDDSTVRKKLMEYVSEEIILAKKQGKVMYYERSKDFVKWNIDALDFFSEVSPCGVIGSFFLDKIGTHEEHIGFKHHYITGAMDSEILCLLFCAMQKKSHITIELLKRNTKVSKECKLVPLRVMLSVQSGRQYLMAYVPEYNRITSYRIDHIITVKQEELCETYDKLRETLDLMQSHMWGVSTQSRTGRRLEHVDFTVTYAEDEEHIHRRLEREKRCGFVEKIDANTSRFSADVYDTSELIPWIRTFICRICEIHFSEEIFERQFKKDIQKMYQMYGLEGGDSE